MYGKLPLPLHGTRLSFMWYTLSYLKKFNTIKPYDFNAATYLYT